MKNLCASVLISSFIYFSAPTMAQERMDPHGVKSVDIHTVNLKENKSCTVCHTTKTEKIEMRSNMDQVCMNCHNKSPHSGVLEHQGKLWKTESGVKEKISCQSCHANHRWGAIESPREGFFISKERKLSAPFHVKTNSEAMLKRTCVECHKW
jgi:hypothetical protein